MTTRIKSTKTNQNMTGARMGLTHFKLLALALDAHLIKHQASDIIYYQA
jgi:hypothetical protein